MKKTISFLFLVWLLVNSSIKVLADNDILFLAKENISSTEFYKQIASGNIFNYQKSTRLYLTDKSKGNDEEQITPTLESVIFADSVKVFDLQWSAIDTFPDNVCACITSLECTLYNKTQLDHLYAQLERMNNLKSLEIRAQYGSFRDATGKKKYIDDSVLKGLFSSKALNALATIHLPEIRSITLTNLSIDTIPDGFARFENLETLYLGANHIQYISPRLSALKNLSLGDNNLSKIPSGIYHLSSLESLFLAKNKLGLLSDSLQMLTNLKELWLNASQFQYNKPLFSKFKNLEKLYMGSVLIGAGDVELDSLYQPVDTAFARGSRNALCNIIKEVSILPHLKSLFLPYNGLTILPPEVGNLASLEELTLDANNLDSLPQSVIQLSKLKYLGISGMPNFSKLPANFSKLSSLEHLDLSNDESLGASELKKIANPNLISLNISADSFAIIDSTMLTAPRLSSILFGGVVINNFSLNLRNRAIDDLILEDDSRVDIPSLFASCAISSKPVSLKVFRNGYTSEDPDDAELIFSKDFFNDWDSDMLNFVTEVDDKLSVSLSPTKDVFTNLGLIKNLQRLSINFPINKKIPLQDYSFINAVAFPNLIELNLCSVQLSKLPRDLDKFGKLRALTINISKEAFDSIPTQILNLKHIHYLCLKKDRITHLPPSMKNCQFVDSLNLDGNAISDISPLTLMPKLTYLSLAQNKIASIPPEVYKMKDLRYLDLSKNPLSNEAIEKLRKELSNCIILF
jgi:Leucine-rich repeat (LRR) protein